jgi:chemotaxis protein CheY-P-specific phosphatase CheC
MLDTIIKAAENFCIHQMNEPHELQDLVTKKRTLIAYIDIDTQEKKKYRVYIASDLSFAQKVSQLFLEEDESDEETLKDMILETANLIIGSAKVIAEDMHKNQYVISTPIFEKIGQFDLEVDAAKTIKIGDSEFTVALKEIDAQE